MKIMKKCLIGLGSLIIVGVVAIASINFYMYQSTKSQLDVTLDDADCILVLGAGIRNNQPTPMLRDRIKQAVRLYNEKKAPKIIMSGDHGQEDYDEVSVMKKYAMEEGVPSTDIFMDHAGFSTYESLYRAKEIFQAKKVIIVTQDYHLYRSLYIANCLGVEAVGSSANLANYSGQSIRDARELLARCKDFVTCITQPKPTYLGDTIPVSGDGNTTNTKSF
ncbi:MAG: ElyC/SanA/YdcF family protein [Coprobacillus sp.]